MRLRIHMTPMKISMIALALMVLIVAVGDSNTVLAATGNEALTTKLDLGMGDDFNDMMRKITGGFLSIAKIVSVIMTATAGIMIAFNLGGPNKMVWNWLLGIGLALNFGGLLLNLPGFGLDSYSLQTATSGYENIPDEIYPKTSKDNDTSFNVFAVFMDYYLNNIILPGAKALTPIAARLLIVLTVIDCSVKLALDLVSGDKIKFLVTVLLKNGFYLWLILNWISGMNIVYRMQDGFQALGFLAGGQDIANVDEKFQPDSIVNNAYMSFNMIWNGSSDAAKDTGLIDSIKNGIGSATHIVSHAFSPLTSLAMLVCIVISIGLLFLTALEMFIARIEFYTMGLLTIPLLAFGAVGQLNFLFRNAVGALFNLAIKVCVISFIQVFSTVMLSRYVKKICDSVEKNEFSAFGNFPIMFQLILVCLILYFMTKNIPNLVNSLLSGSPSLSGGSMASSLKQGMQKGAVAAGATAAVIATGGAAIAGGGIKGGLGAMKGMAMSGLKSTVANSAPVKGFNEMTAKLLGDAQNDGYQGVLNGGNPFAMGGKGNGSSAVEAIGKFADSFNQGKDDSPDNKGEVSKGSGSSGGGSNGGSNTGGDGPSRISNGGGGGASGGGSGATGSNGAGNASGGSGNTSTSESHSSNVSGSGDSYQPRKAQDGKQSQDQDKESGGSARASEQKSTPAATQPAASDRYQDGYADGKKESSNKMSDANGAYVPHHTPTTSHHTSVSTTTSEHASAESVLTKKHEE